MKKTTKTVIANSAIDQTLKIKSIFGPNKKGFKKICFHKYLGNAFQKQLEKIVSYDKDNNNELNKLEAISNLLQLDKTKGKKIKNKLPFFILRFINHKLVQDKIEIIYVNNEDYKPGILFYKDLFKKKPLLFITKEFVEKYCKKQKKKIISNLIVEIISYFQQSMEGTYNKRYLSENKFKILYNIFSKIDKDITFDMKQKKEKLRIEKLQKESIENSMNVRVLQKTNEIECIKVVDKPIKELIINHNIFLFEKFQTIISRHIFLLPQCFTNIIKKMKFSTIFNDSTKQFKKNNIKINNIRESSLIKREKGIYEFILGWDTIISVELRETTRGKKKYFIKNIYTCNAKDKKLEEVYGSTLEFESKKIIEKKEFYVFRPKKDLQIVQVDTYRTTSCFIGVLFSKNTKGLKRPEVFFLGHTNNDVPIPYKELIKGLYEEKRHLEQFSIILSSFPDFFEINKLKDNLLFPENITGRSVIFHRGNALYPSGDTSLLDDQYSHAFFSLKLEDPSEYIPYLCFSYSKKQKKNSDVFVYFIGRQKGISRVFDFIYKNPSTQKSKHFLIPLSKKNNKRDNHVKYLLSLFNEKTYFVYFLKKNQVKVVNVNSLEKIITKVEDIRKITYVKEDSKQKILENVFIWQEKNKEKLSIELFSKIIEYSPIGKVFESTDKSIFAIKKDNGELYVINLEKKNQSIRFTNFEKLNSLDGEPIVKGKNYFIINVDQETCVKSNSDDFQLHITNFTNTFLFIPDTDINENSIIIKKEDGKLLVVNSNKSKKDINIPPIKELKDTNKQLLDDQTIYHINRDEKILKGLEGAEIKKGFKVRVEKFIHLFSIVLFVKKFNATELEPIIIKKIREFGFSTKKMKSFMLFKLLALQRKGIKLTSPSKIKKICNSI